MAMAAFVGSARAAIPTPLTLFTAASAPVAGLREQPAFLAQAASKSASPTNLLAAPLAGISALALAFRGARRQARRSTEMRVTSRMEWYRKVKRIGANKAKFDVTIPKPLGLKMQYFPNKPGIGISQVLEGGNTEKLNYKVIVDDEPGSGMWVLEGDQLIAVNGKDVENGTIEEVVEIMTEADGDITLTLLRNTRGGPVKVVLMPDGFALTVRRNCKLSVAAEAAAGRELKYGCIDGWCGTCWHRERTTNGIFKPCCDVITADWDSVMPLVITPKPEKAGDSSFLKPRGV